MRRVVLRRGEACRNALYAVFHRGEACCNALYAVFHRGRRVAPRCMRCCSEGRSVATCCTWHLQRIVRQVLSEFNETRQQPHRPVRQVLDREARLIVLQRVAGTATLGCRPGVVGVPYWSTRVVRHVVCHPCDSVSHATRYPMRLGIPCDSVPHATRYPRRLGTSYGTWRACQNSMCFIGSSLLMQKGSPATVCSEERRVRFRARAKTTSCGMPCRKGIPCCTGYYATSSTDNRAARDYAAGWDTMQERIPCHTGSPCLTE